MVDADDRCPLHAGLEPDGCPPRDSDGDQVVDSRDGCPEAPGPAANRGCPDRDGDGDGVVDRRDKCGALYGHPDFGGCPAPDADRDAIPDRDDGCPNQPETWNDRRDSDGCPDRGKPLIQVADGRVRFVGKPLFGKGRERLATSERRALVVAARALRSAHTRTVRLEVIAEYGLSYGDSLQRARRRARLIRRELAAAGHLRPEEIEIVCHGPDGNPRVELSYR